MDDGTGVLRCTQWRKEDDSEEGLFIPELGQLVAVWGKVTEFREEKELAVTSMATQKDPNAEPLHWMEVAHLKKTVYSVPFSPHPKFLSGPSSTGVSLKTDIQTAIKRLLRECYSGKHFTLTELCTSDEVLRYCMEQVGSSRSCTEQEVKQQVGEIVSKLPQAGAVVVAMGTGKLLEPKYEVSIQETSSNTLPYVTLT